MMTRMRDVLKAARLEYRNSCGKKLKGRYLAIESDDWGSIRQSSLSAWNEQIKRSAKTLADPFFHYDALESNHDIECILDILTKYVDEVGNHPVMTADFAVANPDFSKIKENRFEKYYYEPFTETAKRYQGSNNLITLYRQGMDEGVWKPQLHCREHVQVSRWMKTLRSLDREIIWAFEHHMISTADAVEPNNHYAYMDAFNYPETDEKEIQILIQDAVELFQKLFGYKSSTFVASCYVWNAALERVLHKNGISCMQGSWYQWIPSENDDGTFIKHIHYNGERSDVQTYLVRNCLFEHSLFGDMHCVDSCLKQIESAFRWHQPAIISSHRVNYMSRIVSKNGEVGFRLLDELLKEVLKRWPDTRFISSDQLAGIFDMEDR